MLSQYERTGKTMSEQTIEELAKKLISRMGRSQAIEICEANKWLRVLEHIKSLDKNVQSA
jgi:hypothetical protein